MTARSALRLRSLLSTRAAALGFGEPERCKRVGSADDLGYPNGRSVQTMATVTGIV